MPGTVRPGRDDTLLWNNHWETHTLTARITHNRRFSFTSPNKGEASKILLQRTCGSWYLEDSASRCVCFGHRDSGEVQQARSKQFTEGGWLENSYGFLLILLKHGSETFGKLVIGVSVCLLLISLCSSAHRSTDTYIVYIKLQFSFISEFGNCSGQRAIGWCSPVRFFKTGILSLASLRALFMTYTPTGLCW